MNLLFPRQEGDTVFTVEYDVAVHERLRDSSGGGCANGGPILVEIRREDERDLLGFGLNR